MELLTTSDKNQSVFLGVDDNNDFIVNNSDKHVLISGGTGHRHDRSSD